MRTHMSRTVSSCFAVLRQLHSIRQSTSPAVLLLLVVLLVLSRLDYGNATLAGLPGHQLNRLQSVMNAAERLVCSARNYEHISLLLCDLQWLWVPEWTEFKLSMLVFRCLHGTALPYLVSELRRVADVDTRKRLRPTSMSALVTPSSCRTTIGDRAFLAALCIWNTLPSSITASGTLNTFKRRLKMHLFVPSFTSIFPNCVQRILFCILTLISVLEVIFTK